MPVAQRVGDSHYVVFFAVRVGGGLGRNSLISGSSVAFVPEIGGSSKLGVFGHLLDVMIVKRTFRCDIVPAQSPLVRPAMSGYERSIMSSATAPMALNGLRSSSASTAGPA
jgi:hypothetical protein